MIIKIGSKVYDITRDVARDAIAVAQLTALLYLCAASKYIVHWMSLWSV